MSSVPGHGQWSQGPIDPEAERIAWENARKYRASGSRPEPTRAGNKMGPDTGIYWCIHLRRAALRVMLQAALAQGRQLNTTDSWEAMEHNFPAVLRAFADQIAANRCLENEPDEYARLEQIPRTEKRMTSLAGRLVEKDMPRKAYAKERAVFLSRYFPVPAPDEWSTATWTIPQMRELGRKLVTAVNMNSDAYPLWPDGWKESCRILKGQK